MIEEIFEVIQENCGLKFYIDNGLKEGFFCRKATECTVQDCPILKEIQAIFERRVEKIKEDIETADFCGDYGFDREFGAIDELNKIIGGK